MSECIFCNIVNQQIPADIVYEDDRVIAFRDINPQAPTHILVIPRQHAVTLADLCASDTDLVGHLFDCATKVALSEGLNRGCRIVVNNGPDGGQVVGHVHVHVLGGRKLQSSLG